MLIYIGPLSRFKTMPTLETNFDILVSISGPEPQRTIFEKIFLNELKNFSGQVLIGERIARRKSNFKCFQKIR